MLLNKIKIKTLLIKILISLIKIRINGILNFIRKKKIKKFNIPKNLKIVIFAYNRPTYLYIILEILKKQNCLKNVTLLIDGDQNTRNIKKDTVFQIAKSYKTLKIINNKSKFGMRKQVITTFNYLIKKNYKIIFIEDDCIPTLDCIFQMNQELDKIKDNNKIFSVYGALFGHKNEKYNKFFSRFQSWGWGTTSGKIQFILKDLIKLYLLNEKEYVNYIKKNINYRIKKKINTIKEKSATKTLYNFFAWDETVNFLCAKKNKFHLQTKKRVFIPLMSNNSVHFKDNYKNTLYPFNMINLKKLTKFL